MAVASAVVLLCAAVIGTLYWPGLSAAAVAWSREEYSYGYMVPPLALYLLVLRLPKALKCVPAHRWLGLVIGFVAVALGIVGGLSRIDDLSGYGFILAISAVLLAYFGLPAMKYLWVPIAYLLFMLPLPQVLYLKLSSSMQLVSSELGAGILRLLDIPVLLEGNIIDLGIYQLQVAEACSGLRYLFPLMSFGFLFAAVYRGATWHKWFLFLSTVPITILMNSIRIAVVGILVSAFGIEMAEGFLHFFQGWVIFVGCIVLLFVEACLLRLLQRPRTPLRGALDIDLPVGAVTWRSLLRGYDPRMLVVSVGMIALGAVLLSVFDLKGANALPQRLPLAGFSSDLDGWTGKRVSLSPDIIRVLGADDYVHRDFIPPSGHGEPINLFIAYYARQVGGRAVHSPEVCLLGGGWEIRDLRTVHPASRTTPASFRVNRAIIQKGLSRSLVYYWFRERDRNVTNQYLAKWYILWDGLTRHRTDGALLRLVTPLPTNGGERAADARLTGFLSKLSPHLPRYLPG